MCSTHHGPRKQAATGSAVARRWLSTCLPSDNSWEALLQALRHIIAVQTLVMDESMRDTWELLLLDPEQLWPPSRFENDPQEANTMLAEVRHLKAVVCNCIVFKVL